MSTHAVIFLYHVSKNPREAAIANGKLPSSQILTWHYHLSICSLLLQRKWEQKDMEEERMKEEKKRRASKKGRKGGGEKSITGRFTINFKSTGELWCAFSFLLLFFPFFLSPFSLHYFLSPVALSTRTCTIWNFCHGIIRSKDPSSIQGAQQSKSQPAGARSVP